MVSEWLLYTGLSRKIILGVCESPVGVASIVKKLPSAMPIWSKRKKPTDDRFAYHPEVPFSSVQIALRVNF